MLIPTVKHFSFGEDLTGAELEDGVESPLEFLYGMPSCQAALAVDSSIGTGGSPKLVSLASETFDNDTMHDNTTNPSRITFTTAGVYLVGGQVTFNTNATASVRQVSLRANSGGVAVNGTRIVLASAAPVTGGGTSVYCSRIASFSANGHMEMWAFQDSGVAINALAGADLTYMFAFMIRV